jgi:hypothetical protein
MIPITQKRVGWPMGQCTESSFASLLECKLEDVPDLCAGLADAGDTTLVEDVRKANYDKLLDWLDRRYGLHLIACKYIPAFETIEEAYEMAIGHISVAEKFILSSAYHLASGNNPDGLGHLVVCKRGKMVHDPNPRRRGIVNCDSVQWLVPRNLLPPDIRNMRGACWKYDWKEG